MSEREQVDYKQLSLSRLSLEIRKDWKNVHYAAEPYLSAISEMTVLASYYGPDSGLSCVRYFLSNAQSWRGPVAREIKKELNTRVKNHNQRR